MNTSTALPPTPIRSTVVAGRWPSIPAKDTGETPPGFFPPTTATLVTGATEAVLIDALYLKDDVQDLGDLIERTGKRLTTIYVTHDHADHYLGIGPLLERFPDARCVALPAVVESMSQTLSAQEAQWEMFFGDATVKPGPLPEPLEDLTLYVDGSPIHVIEVEQADIHPSSIVHVPEIDLVVAGDSIYNEIFPMLSLSGPEEWKKWLKTVDLVESLRPRIIVAGHRRPDGDDRAVDTMIARTRSYIQDFADALPEATDIPDLMGKMAAKYPDLGNEWSLLVSVASAIGRRDAADA